jgi:hypothetical protein
LSSICLQNVGISEMSIMRWLQRLGECHLVRQPGAHPVVFDHGSNGAARWHWC